MISVSLSFTVVSIIYKHHLLNIVRYITHDSYAISVVPPFNRL